MTEAHNEPKIPTTFNFFPIPKTLEFLVLADSKIARVVKDFVLENSWIIRQFNHQNQRRKISKCYVNFFKVV